jgi:hypothetical protein
MIDLFHHLTRFSPVYAVVLLLMEWAFNSYEKNKIAIDGFGKLKPGKKIDVTAKDNTVTE